MQIGTHLVHGQLRIAVMLLDIFHGLLCKDAVPIHLPLMNRINDIVAVIQQPCVQLLSRFQGQDLHGHTLGIGEYFVVHHVILAKNAGDRKDDLQNC
ncbi:hypothetical protein DWY44_02615 [Ruminococcus sp. AF25-19]|nr:hypothetical protein DWY44_02615 [Ruminococcus sp. AF25-19]